MPYTGPEPARRPLSSDDITDGIVSTADLADSAVTTAKIHLMPRNYGPLLTAR
jgi:hypothetical protein